MEGLAWIASATGFAFAMTATPGPNNTMVAASGANYGLRRTLPHVLGVAVGFPVMLLLVAAGVAGVLQESPRLQLAMRWGGALWLLWLAWRIATATPAAGLQGQEREATRGRPMSFLEAALFQWVNPKAWLIAVGGIGAYVGGGGLGPAALLALLFALAAVVCLLGWAALGAGLARLLRPLAMRWFNRVVAVLLVLSLVPVLAP
jgi:threonine/homoserine/homoserine lactone efflux protein